MITRNLFAVVVLILSALAASGCAKDKDVSSAASTPKAEWATLTGRLVYREKMLLPPGANAVVVLTDRARYGDEAARVAETKLDNLVAPPMPFSLKYDAARLQPGAEYGLRATIYVDGKPFFTTPELYLIDLAEGPPLEGVTLLVRRAGAEKKPAGP